MAINCHEVAINGLRTLLFFVNSLIVQKHDSEVLVFSNQGLLDLDNFLFVCRI